MSTSAAMLAASTASSLPGACPFAACGVVACAVTRGRTVQGFLSIRLACGTALSYHWAQNFLFFSCFNKTRAQDNNVHGTICGPGPVPVVPGVPGSGVEIGGWWRGVGGGGGDMHSSGVVVSSPAYATSPHSVLEHFHHPTRSPVLVSGHSHLPPPLAAA